MKFVGQIDTFLLMPTTAEHKPASEEFGRLLYALDSDRERAQFLYKDLQEKLIAIFRDGDCSEKDADALVHQTLGRVEDALGNGAQIGDVTPYATDVAASVLGEAIIEGEKLLRSKLHADPGEAEKLRKGLRKRLTSVFRCNGFPEPHRPKCDDSERDDAEGLSPEHDDPTHNVLFHKTMNRIRHKLRCGADIKNIYAYAATVAKFVCLEEKKRAYKFDSLDDLEGLSQSGVEAEEGERRRRVRIPQALQVQPAVVKEEVVKEDDEELEERRLDCLTDCLKTLPEETQRLILAYYDYSDDKKAFWGDKCAERRKSLARELGIPVGTLRQRSNRIREKLEACVKDCLQKGQ